MADKSITVKENYSLTSPSDLVEMANTIKKFVVDNNLYKPIKDKNYVLVEGWQFAGALIGVFPVTAETQERSTPDEKKYWARVELMRVSDGVKVGAGEAISSSKESMRKGADEFAILSMAQTRATGKAYRLSVGWIMKLAGYEAVSAEEMGVEINDPEPVVEFPIDDVKFIVDSRLAKMAAAEKVKFLKDNASTVTDKNLSDDQFRNLYESLNKQKGN